MMSNNTVTCFCSQAEKRGSAGRVIRSPRVEGMVLERRGGGGGVRVRTALPRDAGAIARLHIDSWRATYRKELSAAFLQGQDLAIRTTGWKVLLEAGASALLAEEGGRALGFVAFGPPRETELAPSLWEIFNLHVAPSEKGRGIGGRLFDAAADLGARAGARTLGLWVFEGNQAARAFYERKGMRLAPEREEHEISPGERVVERRYLMPLAPPAGPSVEDGGGDRYL
jgi:ribosomal protein S18 acetylase RimI-like enzyme